MSEFAKAWYQVLNSLFLGLSASQPGRRIVWTTGAYIAGKNRRAGGAMFLLAGINDTLLYWFL